MTACPFKPATETTTTFGERQIATRRFEQREGLAVSTFEFQTNPEESIGPWPFQSFSQLIFVKRGQISITLPDTGRKTATSGNWFGISLNDFLANSSFSGELEFVVVECSKEIWQSLTSETDALLHTKKACFGCSQRLEPVFFKNLSSERIQHLTSELLSTKGENATERLLIEAKSLELLALASNTSSINATPSFKPCLPTEEEEALMAAAAFIEGNLSASHSLAEVSRKANLNEFKLKKGFRHHFKTTVFGYLRQKRMEHAREILSSKNCTVLEVAQAVGYANPSHFTRAFRENFGINPKDFLSSAKRVSNKSLSSERRHTRRVYRDEKTGFAAE